MKVKVELELDILTEWHEVKNCTPENFKEHVEFIIKEEFSVTIDSDIEYTSKIIKFEVQ